MQLITWHPSHPAFTLTYVPPALHAISWPPPPTGLACNTAPSRAHLAVPMAHAPPRPLAQEAALLAHSEAQRWSKALSRTASELRPRHSEAGEHPAGLIPSGPIPSTIPEAHVTVLAALPVPGIKSLALDDASSTSSRGSSFSLRHGRSRRWGARCTGSQGMPAGRVCGVAVHVRSTQHARRHLLPVPLRRAGCRTSLTLQLSCSSTMHAGHHMVDASQSWRTCHAGQLAIQQQQQAPTWAQHRADGGLRRSVSSGDEQGSGPASPKGLPRDLELVPLSTQGSAADPVLRSSSGLPGEALPSREHDFATLFSARAVRRMTQ